MLPQRVPDVVFHTRVRNPALGGDNPFEWRDVATADIFAGKRVVLFGVPGAFTPACSDSHLPGYERNHDAFAALGIDTVACLSVNDAFVMYQWARSRAIEKVVMLPDGNGDFTRRMGLLVTRTRHGMGMRSWRYSLLAEDGVITAAFLEPGVRDDPDGVGLTVSDAQTMLDHLRNGRG
jgi:thioredoxin-dependent peroxiredoxin